MTTSDQSNGFADSGLARLLALFIAIAIAFLLWSNWSTDFKALLAGDDQEVSAATNAQPAKPANPELENCLAQRVGDVDRMKEEGILSESQYAAFRGRAEELCRAQNPG